MLVDSTSQLEEICAELLLNAPKFIAIDTEFMRNFNLYYPKLCLIQIAYNNKKFIIDVLNNNLNLSLLKPILYNKNIVKVFHDCRQDIEAILTVFSQVPHPIFDTQIAAMFCKNYDNSIGYSRLVEQFTGIKLDKTPFKKSDWINRPLSQDKINYAFDDVIYLHDIYQKLYDQLVNCNKLTWFLEEMENITDIKIYKTNPSEMWNNYQPHDELIDEKIILIAKSLAQWREAIAQHLNINRNNIINTNNIITLSRELSNSQNFSTLGKYIKKEFLLRAPISLNNIIEKNKKYPIEISNNIKVQPNKSILNILLIVLHNICDQNSISQKLVASQNDLIELINGKSNNIMKGWRYELFGNYIESFMNGRLKVLASANVLKDGNIDITTNLVKA